MLERELSSLPSSCAVISFLVLFVLPSKSVCLPCFPSSNVVRLVRPVGGVPFAGMTVYALQTLIQACVSDGLSGAISHQQVSAPHVPSPFGVKSILVAFYQRRQKSSAADSSGFQCGKSSQI